MEPRRFSWQDPTGNHQIVLAWVPGTSGTSYGFGHGSQRRAIELSSFFISTTPVTQALWMHVMSENPAIHHDPLCPVENVSFEQIVSPGGFLDRINASDVLSGVAQGDATLRFRLPSEAEWEDAARGGPNWQDDFAFSGSNNPDEVAWYGPRWRRADEAVFKLLGWPRGWYWPNYIRKLLPRHTEIHPRG
jgi:formylglycine-generating enzyme required for sulfatase activity